jgi:hypothetical protein
MFASSRCSAVSLALLLAVPCSAQLSYGGVPPSAYAALQGAVPVLTLPPVDEAALLAEDATRGKGPLRYGALVEIDASIDELGAREQLASGESVWRIEIRSPGARTLAVVFEQFQLPLGGRLYVYDPARTQLLGAYTDLNNQENLEFGFQPLLGDRLVLEYVEPAAPEFHAVLHVREAIHDYRGLPDMLAKSADSGDAAGACEVDTNCPQAAAWQDKKHAIARTLSGGALCTGALLNNVQNNGTQYFMTAYHCGSLNSAVFLFNYEKSGCGSGSAPSNQTVSGSTELAGNSGYDYRLVRITQAIPSTYKPFFLGWNRTTSAPGSTCCIHHPTGDVKKISFDNNAPTFSGNQWRVSQWDLGVTEPGSSGSPLLRNDGRFIGQLYGGASYCGYPYDDYYGRFDLAWPTVKAWLDPQAANPSGIDGYDPYGAPATPPSITNLTPATAKAFGAATATINGNNFTNATQVKVASATLLPPFGFTIVSNTQITFTPPIPTALGAAAVTVVSSAGTSNAINLSYTETNPPTMAVAAFGLTNANFGWDYGGGASDFAFLLVSSGAQTLPILGANILTSYAVLKSQVLNSVGLGSHLILVPPSALGITVYSQLATYDGTLRSSSVYPTTIVF